MNRELESLFIVYDYISREIGIAQAEMEGGEFKEGHINGLKEARNRVEQAIAEISESNTAESSASDKDGNDGGEHQTED